MTVQANLLMQNNPAVNIIDYPQLFEIGGNLDLTGNFQSVELPDLSTVSGGINVETTSSTFQCPQTVQDLSHANGFVCAGNINNPVPGIHGGTTSGHKSGAIKRDLGMLCPNNVS